MPSLSAPRSVLLVAALLQLSVHAQAPAAASGPVADKAPATSTWRERLAHDWDFLSGRSGPVHQALAAAREDLRSAGNERFVAKRAAQSDKYLQQALSELQKVWRDVLGQWIDPMFAQRLRLVTRMAQAMAAGGALVQTPALYHRLDWELSKLLHWRWAP